MISLGKTVEKISSLGKTVERMYSYGKIVYDKKKEELPYIRLQWIECTGTQYSNTEISNEGNVRIKDQIMIKNYTDKEFMIFGGRATYTYAWGVYYNQSQSILAAQGKSFVSFKTNSYPLNSWIEIELKPGYMIWNGQQFSMESTELFPPNNGPIFLDALYYQGGVDSRKCKAIRGETEIYVDNILVFHSFPCLLRETGEIGRWDLVSNTFVGNIGSGNYIAGPVAE